VLHRDADGAPMGRAIRRLLLDHGHGVVAPATEVLLYFADRAQHVAELVRPALREGRSVVSDRYTDSSLGYQGYGRGLDRGLILAVHRLATGGLQPDVTILLDVSVDVGLARASSRGALDRLESEGPAFPRRVSLDRLECDVRDFQERVRAGYIEMARAEPERWVRVDGEGSTDAVAARV